MKNLDAIISFHVTFSVNEMIFLSMPISIKSDSQKNLNFKLEKGNC